MSVALRINIDITISRKSENECHSCFKIHISSYPVIRVYHMLRKKIETVFRRRSRVFRDPVKNMHVTVSS